MRRIACNFSAKVGVSVVSGFNSTLCASADMQSAANRLAERIIARFMGPHPPIGQIIRPTTTTGKNIMDRDKR
jgi:hypothetical protein